MNFIGNIIGIIWEIFQKIGQLFTVFKQRKLDKVAEKDIIKRTDDIQKRVEKEVKDGKIDDLNKEIGWKG